MLFKTTDIYFETVLGSYNVTVRNLPSYFFIKTQYQVILKISVRFNKSLWKKFRTNAVLKRRTTKKKIFSTLFFLIPCEDNFLLLLFSL